jgi:hypothetical protein
MELEYIKIKNYDRVQKPCPYNDGCHCDQYQRTRCYRCGWNPKVAEKRIAKILGRECKE